MSDWGGPGARGDSAGIEPERDRPEAFAREGRDAMAARRRPKSGCLFKALALIVAALVVLYLLR